MSTDTTLAASSHTPIDREDSANLRTPEQDAFASPLERKLFLDQLNTNLFGASERHEAAAIGRFRILRKVGHGGMGVVFLGYDELLDRKAAIKLLRAQNAPRGTQKRMLREAQGLARLSHPNVVQLYDTGVHEGSTYIAMEFIAGQTLGAWLRDAEPRRGLEEVTSVFIAAGRGLAAAHRAGLVHRDFKPENVMISEDGQVKVMDFGLARALGEGTREIETELEGSGIGASSGAELSITLTRTGAVLGTPAYMSPEQFAATSSDARSDQFSFCVSLWEALFGQRPFAGETLGELSEAVRAGKIRDSAGDSRVPGDVERALRRGLSAEPTARWESVDALLDELERDRAGERGRWWTRGAVALAIAGSLGFAAAASERSVAPPDPCPAGDVHLEGLWDGPTREAVEAGILRGGGEHGESVAARVLPTLDAYADGWLAMHQDACEATHVRHEQSSQLLDRRMSCLDERRVGLRAAVELLEDGESAVVDDAMRLLTGLSPVEPCGDRNYLESQIPTPANPELAAKVTQLRERKAKVKVEAQIGGVAALVVLEELLAEAEALDYAPLRAELLVALGMIESQIAAPLEARAHLERGMHEAVRTGQELVAAEAATELVYLIGQRLDDVDGGLRLAELARAWYAHADGPPLGPTTVLLTESLVRLKIDPDSAVEGLREVLERLGLDERLEGLDELEPRAAFAASVALNGLAVYTFKQGDVLQAREYMLRVRQVRRRLLGPTHPQLLLMELNLGAVNMTIGNWSQARSGLEPLLPIYRERVESRPGDLRMALQNLMELALMRFELLGAREREPAAAAIAAMHDYLEAAEEPLPGSHQGLVLSQAKFARLDGRLDDALAAIEQAETLMAAQPQQWDPAVGHIMLELERAQVMFARGDTQAALARFEQQLELALENDYGPGVADAKLGTSEVLIALGRGEEARPMLMEVVAELDAFKPTGHPYSIVALELLAELGGAAAAAYRERADTIRARLEADQD